MPANAFLKEVSSDRKEDKAQLKTKRKSLSTTR